VQVNEDLNLYGKFKVFVAKTKKLFIAIGKHSVYKVILSIIKLKLTIESGTEPSVEIEGSKNPCCSPSSVISQLTKPISANYQFVKTF